MKSFALFLLLASALPAADAGKRYLSLKDDSGIFVGEGAVDLKEFKDDSVKALQAARERAQAALAAAIQVRVKSEIKEESDSAGGETLTAKSESLADVVLEGIRFDEFPDMPQKGKVTVLAWVTKEQYRRTLAGKKPPVWKVEKGLRLSGGTRNIGWVDRLKRDMSVLPPSMANPFPYWDMTLPKPNGPDLSLGMEFHYRGFVLGFDHTQGTVNGWLDLKSGAQPSKAGSLNFSLSSLQLGYDWAPLNWRLQPFLPLRWEYQFWQWGSIQERPHGLSAGLGLRYWITDFLAVDAKYAQHFGLSSLAEIPTDIPGEFWWPGGNHAMDGARIEGGLIWSGF